MSWQWGPRTAFQNKTFNTFVRLLPCTLYLGISHWNHEQNHRKNVESHLAMSRFFIHLKFSSLGALRSAPSSVALMQNLDSELDAGGLEGLNQSTATNNYTHTGPADPMLILGFFFFVCQENGGRKISPKTERFWEDRMFFWCRRLGVWFLWFLKSWRASILGPGGSTLFGVMLG